MCILNHGLEWDKWVLTNLFHSIDCGLTHLFLGRTSHTRGLKYLSVFWNYNAFASTLLYSNLHSWSPEDPVRT